MSATVMDERILMIQNSMYQYSRAIYRSIKDLVDPYVDRETQLDYRREVLAACEGTMERLAADPHYFAKPDKALFQDIRRYFPITVQAQVAWSVNHGVNAAVSFVEDQIEAGAFDGGVARCRATTRKGKPCQRTPLPERDEFTGEELYTLRSERYFLPELELDDEELAALQTCFYLLEGRFAYAEPLRLALQNLALGRSAGDLAARPTGTALRVEVRDPDYPLELQGRLGKVEGAISKQRTVKFRYWSIYRDEEVER